MPGLIGGNSQFRRFGQGFIQREPAAHRPSSLEARFAETAPHCGEGPLAVGRPPCRATDQASHGGSADRELVEAVGDSQSIASLALNGGGFKLKRRRASMLS